jgi:hypothetical protein
MNGTDPSDNSMPFVDHNRTYHIYRRIIFRRTTDLLYDEPLPRKSANFDFSIMQCGVYIKFLSISGSTALVDLGRFSVS